MTNKRTNFSPDFKASVIKDLMTNNLSLRKAADKYNIKYHSVVQSWVKVYQKHGYQGFYHKQNRCSTQNTTTTQKQIDDLITENQRLSMENDFLKKLDALIREKKR